MNADATLKAHLTKCTSNPMKKGCFTEMFHMKFIWLYFILVMLFMTTIMLNFMIAVIMDTYDEVSLIEDRYRY